MEDRYMSIETGYPKDVLAGIALYGNFPAAASLAITHDGLRADTATVYQVIEIRPQTAATDAQKRAFAYADFTATQAEGSVTITANGVVPQVAIPIVLIAAKYRAMAF
jgi:hypothetical protein